jgi:hypothetical protein
VCCVAHFVSAALPAAAPHTSCGQGGRTLLYSALENDNLDMARLLIECKSAVDATDNVGNRGRMGYFHIGDL